MTSIKGVPWSFSGTKLQRDVYCVMSTHELKIGGLLPDAVNEEANKSLAFGAFVSQASLNNNEISINANRSNESILFVFTLLSIVWPAK